jgi:hypothetical protein
VVTFIAFGLRLAVEQVFQRRTVIRRRSGDRTCTERGKHLDVVSPEFVQRLLAGWTWTAPVFRFVIYAPSTLTTSHASAMSAAIVAASDSNAR